MMRCTKISSINVPSLNLGHGVLQDRKFRRSGNKDVMKPATDRTLNSSASDPCLNLSYISSKKLGQDSVSERIRDEQFSLNINNLKKKFMRSHETQGKEKKAAEAIRSRTQKQWGEQIKLLKKENAELKQKISILNQHKPTNKLRQNIHRQRIKELQKQNQQLKLQLSALHRQNGELKESKSLSYLPQDTASSISFERDSFISNRSICLSKFNQKQQLQNLQKEIKNLNDIISKQQIQIDFFNRKAFAENQHAKTTFEGMLKSVKQKLNDSWRENNELKKINYDLRCQIRYLNEQIESPKRFAEKNQNEHRIFKMNRTDTLLSLSSEGDFNDY